MILPWRMLLCLVFALEVTCGLRITATNTKHQRVRSGRFYVHADTAISQCQFNVLDLQRNSGPGVIDIANLTDTLTSTGYDDDTAVARYDTDLQRGRCGVTVSPAYPNNLFVVGCRVREARGPWVYHWSTIFKPDNGSPDVTTRITPEDDVYVTAGSDVNVTCHTDVTRKCIFYSAAGLTKWDRDYTLATCGATYTVPEQEEGFLTCTVFFKDTRAASIQAITAPTSPPELVTPSENLKEGDMLEATCTAGESRPPVNITWHVGGRPVDVGDVEDLVEAPWKWSWQKQGRRQRLRRRLSSRDVGDVDVTCQVEHVGLSRPLRNSKHIRVQPTATIRPEGTHCPALSSSSIRFHCYLRGRNVDCSLHMDVSTEADMECKAGYVINNFTPYTTISCSSDGGWSGTLLDCVPDCGRRNFVSQELISGGEEAKVGEFPWHVGIYRNVSNSFEQICGGSLITSRLAVSAAHCFWDNVFNRQLPASSYKMAAGKFYRDWNTDDASAQYRDISDIFVPARYEGIILNGASDIAVVRVFLPIELSLSVNVACVDWRRESEHTSLYPGVNGTVAGWGLTSDDVSSPTLRTTELPFVSYEACKATVPRDFRRQITADKFCGGWVNRSVALCPGDSGGGFMFAVPTARGSQYFLRGVVSVGPTDTMRRCNAQQLTLFTKVSEHFSWLLKIVFPKTGDS